MAKWLQSQVKLDPVDYPKLRCIEAFPVDYQGRRLVCLRDTQNLSGKMLFVPPEGVFILSLFDGKHSVLDIQGEFMRQFGQLVYREDVEGLVNQLDDALMLDNQNYKNFKKKVEEEFRDSPIRESSHAGLSYPDEAEEVKNWLGEFFNAVEKSHPVRAGNGKLSGLISPHIDFRRGGRSYALAYRELINSDVDTFIIFGTSHYAEVENPFILTRKNFITPLGFAETDTRVADELAQQCSWDLFDGEIFHRQEHSIEFQVVFLQYLFGGKKRFKILPILCNSFFRMINNGESPSEDGNISTFLKLIGDIISSNNRACVIAGADMAHVGLKFGDHEPVGESTLRWIKERDLLSLSFTENIDAQGFFKSIEEEKDKRKICGLSPIYALLSTIKAEKGKLLDYDQALEPDTGSVVSFASVGFYS